MRYCNALVGSLFALVAGSALAECSSHPGKARWPIKTSIVAAASTATAVALSDLLALNNPAVTSTMRKQLETGRLARQQGMAWKEGDMITTEGVLDLAKCNGDDDDYHIQIRTADDPSSCLIVEVPNAQFVTQPGLGPMVAKVRQTVRGIYSGKIPNGASPGREIRVRITGQLFYDSPHYQASHPQDGGGRGKGTCKATNLWEIHPIVRFEVL